MLDRAQSDAAARWFKLLGVPSALGEAWLVTAMRTRGVPWFVDQLARMEPVVLGGPMGALRSIAMSYCPGPSDQSLVVRHAISSVLVCLRREFDVADYHFVADLLLDRGHTWLGEPLNLWLAGGEANEALAARMLIERLPVLPEFAQWRRGEVIQRASNMPSLAPLAAYLLDEPQRNDDMRRVIARDGQAVISFSRDGAEPQHVHFDADSMPASAIADAINEQAHGVTATTNAQGWVVMDFDDQRAEVTISEGRPTPPAPRRATKTPRQAAGQSWQSRASSRRSRWR